MFCLKIRFSNSGKNFFIEYPFKINNPRFIKVGNRFRVFYGSRIECITNYNNQIFKPKLIIGNHVTINNNFHIGVINKIIIDDEVLIASNVFITDHLHGDYGHLNNTSPRIPPRLRNLFSIGPVHIKKNCWIGEGVCILPNVTIGEGSIIGANSVVTCNIPSYSIAVGVPAKVIKKFNFEIQKWIKV